MLHPYNPLHMLLQKNVAWQWGPEQEQAVAQIKRDLVADVMLAHFDPKAKLVLTVDASPHGLERFCRRSAPTALSGQFRTRRARSPTRN